MPRLTLKRLKGEPSKPRELLVGDSGLRARGTSWNEAKPRDRNRPRGWTFFFRQEVEGPRDEDGQLKVDKSGEPVRAWQTFTIGPFGTSGRRGTFTLQEALAAMLAKQLELESAPAQGSTVDEAAQGYLERYAVKNNRGEVQLDEAGEVVLLRRGQKTKRLLEIHALNVVLPSKGRFGSLPVGKVEAADFRTLVNAARPKRVHGRRDRGGEVAALLLVPALQRVLGYAVKNGQLRASPFADWVSKDFGLKTPASRARMLSADEVAALLRHPAIDLPGLLAGAPYHGKLQVTVRAAAPLLLLTALRTAGLFGTRREDVDLAAKVLTLKPHLHKGDADLKEKAAPFAVPLSTTAVAVIDAMDRYMGAHRTWLFPKQTDDGPLYPTALVNALEELQNSGSLKLPGGNVTGHDLRRTWASTATRLKVDAVVADWQLQHKLGKRQGLSDVAATYMRDPLLDLRRDAVELVDEHWREHWSNEAIKVRALK